MVFGWANKRVARWRAWLLPRVKGGTQTVVDFQRRAGVYAKGPHPHERVDQHLQSSISPAPSTNSLAGSSSGSSDSESDAAATPKHNGNGVANGIGKGNGVANGEGTGKVTADSDGDEHDDRAAVGGDLAIGYRSAFVHYYFTAAAALGNELFYITFLPALFWAANVPLARRVIVWWVAIYYVGQFLKDVLKLPRPPCPPVLRLERHYETEYGFPSTHAMAAVYTPFMMCAAGYEIGWIPDVQALGLGLVLALVWVVSVCLSRLYMGVHCPTDIVGGLLLGVGVLSCGVLFGSRVDAFVTRSPHAPWLVPAVAVVLTALYPRPAKWTNAYGDTTLILGTGVGVLQASTVHLGEFQSLAWSTATRPLAVSCALFLARMAVGVAVLFTTRMVFKAAGFAVLKPLFQPKDAAARKTWNPNRTYATEIPVKLLVYAAVGFNAVFTCPWIFARVGI